MLLVHNAADSSSRFSRYLRELLLLEGFMGIEEIDAAELPARLAQSPGATMTESEKLDMAEERQIEGDRHEELGVAGLLESGPLDRAVDDLLGQVEGQIVGDHGQGDDQQDEELLRPGMDPNVPGEAFFHKELLCVNGRCLA